jgi:hypothetical protein
VPVKAAVLKEHVFVLPDLLLLDAPDYEKKDNASYNYVQSVQAGHEEVQEIKQSFSAGKRTIMFHAREQSVFKLGGPFKVLVYKEDPGCNDGHPDQPFRKPGVAFLNGRNGHGHGHTADEQDDRVDGSYKHIQVVGGMQEIFVVDKPVHHIHQEQSSEQQDFGEQEQPHPHFGGYVIAVVPGVGQDKSCLHIVFREDYCLKS